MKNAGLRQGGLLEGWDFVDWGEIGSCVEVRKIIFRVGGKLYLWILLTL